MKVSEMLKLLRATAEMKYAIIIEKSETGYGASVPDLPGCVAVGETEGEVRLLIREAIEFHLEGLREDGVPVPPPVTQVDYVDVPSAA
jgi:predicted RNase H-like HicB family nuclease